MNAATQPHLLLPCMGGWCAKRGKCVNYLDGIPMTVGDPPDRLCTRGRDGESVWAIVVVVDDPELVKSEEAAA